MIKSYLPFSIVQKLMFSIALVSTFTVTAHSIGCPNGSLKQANIGSAKSTEFVFNENESEENAEKNLLERFPVGSKMTDFTSAMQEIKKFSCTNHTNQVVCEYIIPTTGAASYRWLISASNKQDKITKIYMRKYFTPYYPKTRQDGSTTKLR
jgi:hypothetical protein